MTSHRPAPPIFVIVLFQVAYKWQGWSYKCIKMYLVLKVTYQKIPNFDMGWASVTYVVLTRVDWSCTELRVRGELVGRWPVVSGHRLDKGEGNTFNRYTLLWAAYYHD